MGLKDLINNAHKSKATKEIDPICIFNLSNRQPGYAYLRANQEEFLNKWNDRRGDRDIVGVLNTGAGKTLIGLLMSKSKMIETGLPAIYLCPTQQLVNQVKKQAKYYGIEVCTVDDDWENDFHNADKILVTTFHKVFNGKSVFGVKGYSNSFPSIGSIVIDDAHACIKYARQQSTITINNDENYFKLLLELFKDDLRYQSEGKYNSIIRGEHSVCL
ncbi:TPA: DEAD/DEAH box helicase, partial [Streptococcus suis]|nr:DEAD/DEAH box helicase [Streptococcus suis]